MREKSHESRLGDVKRSTAVRLQRTVRGIEGEDEGEGEEDHFGLVS